MTEAQQELWEKIEDVRHGDDDHGRRWTGRFAAGRCGRRETSSTAASGSSASDDGAAGRGAAHANPRVGLSYAAPDKDLYVSVSGPRPSWCTIEAKAEELWNAFAQAWFPDGVDDPHLVLLRVDVEQAQYWEDKKPKVLQFAEIVLGAVTRRSRRRAAKRRSSTSRRSKFAFAFRQPVQLPQCGTVRGVATTRSHAVEPPAARAPRTGWKSSEPRPTSAARSSWPSMKPRRTPSSTPTGK